MGSVFSPVVQPATAADTNANPLFQPTASTSERSPRTSSSSRPSRKSSLVITDSQDNFYSPTGSGHGTSTNERLRAREMLRYYTPPSPTPEESDTSSSYADESVLDDSELDSVEVPPPSPKDPSAIGGSKTALKSSEDPALTAFAQLLALKLDCQRSMISLIDKSKQYIVAEATRTLSITDITHQAGPDGLWLGCETIPSEGGLCVNTVQLFPPPTTDTSDPDGYPILEIEDLSLDERFQKRDYVVNYPYLRFYAGTPLRTKRGYNIGSLCVVDSTPRKLTEDERKTLGRMGKLVMRHLELTAETRALKRNQRMAESLGRFVARKHGALDGGIDDKDDEDEEESAEPDMPKPSTHAPGTHANPVHGTGKPSLNTSNPVTGPSKIEEVFSRASTLIREALVTDGVVFVDADKVYGTSALHREATPERKPTRPGMQKRRKSRVLGISSVVTGDGATSWDGEHLRDLDFVEEPLVEEARKGCGVLPHDAIVQQLMELYPHGTIFSFDDGSSSNASNEEFIDSSGAPPSPSYSTLGMTREERIGHEVQNFLPGCTAVLFLPLFHASGRPYAASFSWSRDERRIFTHDELSYMRGFMSSIMAEVSRLNTLSADKAKGDFISSISHELRSPLHGVLASAEFLSETTLDVFQRSFVDTIESCGRMLLDTINHVLDFSKLNSLMKDQNQKQIGDSIGGVGRIKGIDSDQESKSGSGPIRRSSSNSGVVSLIEATDLSIIAEQVVESVYAGYEFKGISSPGLTERDLPISTAGKKQSSGDAGLLDNNSGRSVVRGASYNAAEEVTVILDIDHRDEWTFITQPGAVRRILMNIVGNALKYTDSGWVKVRLEAEDLASSQDRDADEPKSKVTFTVSDSGRGISREFLKSKLFTPFSQEDTLTSGTGLGMSIVRQIVQLLGGDIKVESQVGVGTEVAVTLFLSRRPDDIMSSGQPKGISNVAPQKELSLTGRFRQLTMGKTICLWGFGPSLPPPSSPPAENEVPSSNALGFLVDCLARYSQTWYNLDVVFGDPRTVAADLYLVNESLELVELLQEISSTRFRRIAPVVALCGNVSHYRTFAPPRDSGYQVEFISKPCGPIKLGKALRSCFEPFTTQRETSILSPPPIEFDISPSEPLAQKQPPANDIVAHLIESSSETSRPFVASPSPMSPSLNESSEPVVMDRIAMATPQTKPPDVEPLDARKTKNIQLHCELPSKPSLVSPSSLAQPSPPLSHVLAHRDHAPLNRADRRPEAALNMLGSIPNILIVEDNPINLMLLATFMKKRKYPFSQAENGLLAVQAVEARAQQFDFILMDLQMPVMSGIEAIRVIRSTEAQNSSIGRSFIIALTGLAGSDDMDEAYDAGVDLFLTKPVSFKLVDREIENWKQRVKTSDNV